MDMSQGGLRLGSTGSGFDEEDAGREGGGASALPAPILTPEGARQLSALMDGVVHEFTGMVCCFTLPNTLQGLPVALLQPMTSDLRKPQSGCCEVRRLRWWPSSTSC